MLLLHISDIHFRAPECIQGTDPNRVYRTRLVQDARKRVKTLGKVDAILVGGDIAYRGAQAEYAAARSWLQELMEATGCPVEGVFVVPGNHDVDRGHILRTLLLRNAHEAIRRADAASFEWQFNAQLNDELVGREMFAPLANYNDFAKEFNCQVYPGKVAWVQDLDLAPGLKLRLHGFTTTMLSGAVNAEGHQNDLEGSLYMSPAQVALLDPQPHLVNLVMAHHPPGWLRDQDDVEDAMHGRAAIHVWGHKHRQRILQEKRFVSLSAGAVNPDRHEPGWQPGYNFIDLAVHGVGADRKLRATVQLLQWQTNPEGFSPRLTEDESPLFVHDIACPCDDEPRSATVAQASVAAAPPAIAASTATTAMDTTPDVEAAMGEKSVRHLITQWWGLPVNGRREIALGMGLIVAEEIALPEPERYGRALLRAKERGQLDQLAEEINEWLTKTR